MNLGEAPLRIEGAQIFVFPHKDKLIPDHIFRSTRWTKSGLPDRRMKSSREAFDWIERESKI